MKHRFDIQKKSQQDNFSTAHNVTQEQEPVHTKFLLSYLIEKSSHCHPGKSSHTPHLPTGSLLLRSSNRKVRTVGLQKPLVAVLGCHGWLGTGCSVSIGRNTPRLESEFLPILLLKLILAKRNKMCYNLPLGLFNLPPLMLETWLKLLAPDFVLAQSWLLPPFGECTRGWKICLSPSLLFSQ